MAYLSRQGPRSAAVAEAGAFLVGKALIYTLLGGLALVVGAELQRTAIPLALIARRALVSRPTGRDTWVRCCC
jgi:hypothetical protein